MAIVTCEWCGRQVINSHECAEKRRGLAALNGEPAPSYDNTFATTGNDAPTVAEILHGATDGDTP